jgi:cyclophilin family peptidyl-prolyl cis-trans isomerase
MPSNKRERQRENRAKKLEAQKKLERQRKLRTRAIRFTVLAAVLAGLLVLPGLLAGGEDEATTTTTETTTTTTTTTTTPPTTVDLTALPRDYDGYRAQATACGAEPPPPRTEMQFDGAEDQAIPVDATVTATITTSCGAITAQLDPSVAPETVNSFVFLARQGYFDGTVFHRIVADFVIQGGDPSATGAGNPGYLVPDEFPEADFTYGRGVLAMANSGENSTGSQFFIVTADDARLPNRYSAFGNVVDSDETLDRIRAISVIGRDGTTNGEQSLPLETVYIETVSIEVNE